MLAAGVWGCCPAARETVKSINTTTRKVDDLNRTALTRIFPVELLMTPGRMEYLTPARKRITMIRKARELRVVTEGKA